MSIDGLAQSRPIKTSDAHVAVHSFPQNTDRHRDIHIHGINASFTYALNSIS